jgi:FAD-linked sulfhydryl oxidase
MAAYYPDTPSAQHQSAMRTFMNALPLLYPCSHCASDLGEDLKRDPPDVSSRERLSRWMCVLHNGVNRKLGKEEFNCDRVDERWRDGWKDGRCD